MEVGKITSPVKTESGYYILKLLDKRVSDEGADEFSVQEILLKIEPGYGTIDSLRTIATELHEKAEQQGLIQAATDTNLTVITTQAFFQNYPIEGFGFSPKLSEFAFSNEKGTLSGVMRDDTRFFIATVSDRIPESLKPITDADIQEIILEQLKIEKVKKIAHDKARAFFQQAVATDFQSTLDNMGLTSQKPEPFQVSKNIERFGAYSPFATAAFALNTGGISPPIESHGSYFVIKLLSRTPFDAADYETKMASIGSRLFQEKVQEFMVYWYGKLEENSNIEDYREAF
jgi:parvulin-like peptidyl-prolyl isomerase